MSSITLTLRESSDNDSSRYPERIGTSSFAKLLLDWYERERRDLPWRNTSDPYAIWVSEIMLQQTRVATVIPYYLRFLTLFPTPVELANAEEEKLLGAWAGLGYYSRVRNMQRAAQEMARGVFPSTYEAIRELPGVGDYTAAAVGSIAFGLPHAAVDGNVLRVMSRVADDGGDIGSSVTRERLREVTESLLDRRRPGEFNQAMMELGATTCVPRDPQCQRCPVSAHCNARAAGRQKELPVKLRKTEILRVTRRLFIVPDGGRVLMWRRKGFWELPEREHFSDRVPRARIVGEFRHSIMNCQYRFEVAVTSSRSAARLTDELESNWVDTGSGVLSTTSRKALSTASVSLL